MHTKNSDGSADVEFLLDRALDYSNKKLYGKPMYLAITDHNTV